MALRDSYDRIVADEIDRVLIAQGVVSTSTRSGMTDSQFALVYTNKAGQKVRKLPLNNAAHVRNAMARFNQTQFPSAEAKATARRKVLAAARKFGIKADNFVTQGVFDESTRKPTEGQPKVGQKNPTLRPMNLTVKSRPTSKKRIMAQAGMVVQSDAALRVVTAVLQTPNSENRPPMTHPDETFTYTPEAVRDMAWNFMAEGRQGAIGVNHSEVDFENGTVRDMAGEVATMVESYVAPIEMAFPASDGTTRLVAQGSWLGSFRINAEDVWSDIEAERLQAPSIVLEVIESEAA